MKTVLKTQVEIVLLKELLYRSYIFRKLHYNLIVIHGFFVFFTITLFLMGNINESMISAISGFSSTTAIKRAGKESRQSLEILLRYLEKLD